MDKQYYDHRCKDCPTCAHHWPGGERDTSLGLTYYPEGCRRYGYSFNPYPEDADSCEGYQTEAQYKAEQTQKELLKKKRKK